MFTQEELEVIFDLVEDAFRTNIDSKGDAWNIDLAVIQNSILAKIRNSNN